MNKDNTFDEANVEVEDYSCPNCEAALRFLPEKQVLHCDYCDFEINVDGTVGTEEYDFLENAKIDNSWGDETKVVHCDNCGANTVIENVQMSFTCPFCGSNSVMQTDEISGIKPQRVIPFKIANSVAKDNYYKWLKKKFYVPKVVKQEIPKVELKGVYLPVWTFDTNTFSIYRGRLGKYYTKTVGSGKNKRTVTSVRYYPIRGKETVNFDDLIINAGSKLSQDEISRLQPFNTNDSYEYNKNYLVGFSAEHYDIKLNEGWEKSKPLISNRIRSSILSHYIYDVVSYLDVNTTYNDITYKYVLIPIWIGLYSYNNKQYRFITNGETGKIIGKYPISALKVVLTVIISLVCLILFLLLLGFFE